MLAAREDATIPSQQGVHVAQAHGIHHVQKVEILLAYAVPAKPEKGC
jgi:hypothetical protein